MKRFIVLAAGSLALAAGNAAFAEGCIYGQKAAMADASGAHDAAVEENMSPELLALLEKKEAESLEETLVVPNIHN